MSDSVTVWTVASQAPLSMEFLRQKYWSGLPFPTPEDIPDPGIEPMSAAPPALVGRFLPLSHLGSLFLSSRLYPDASPPFFLNALRDLELE